SGDRLPFGDLVFDVLSPALVNPESINNNSVVLRLTAGRVVFLFTGDSDQLEERRLLEAGLAEPVDVLKVGHHGGDTSSNPAYIAAISPDVAVYSVGAGNEYQFPHAVVLDALRGAGALIYGTDRNGTIVVRTDGTTYEVLTERGGPRE
ncbi:MAG TPA: hypothetical protein VFF68_10810, partial [Anaerolineaceae bacterium]|nr:hypothetical protein [Anaerolineaceae bacterium]